MTRRSFLSMLALLPGLGWIKPQPVEAMESMESMDFIGFEGWWDPLSGRSMGWRLLPLDDEGTRADPAVEPPHPRPDRHGLLV
jgi:hypothetical protein